MNTDLHGSRGVGAFSRAAAFALLLLLAVRVSGADEAASGAGNGRAEPPPFTEVFDLVRTNAAGLSREELNRAAVRGLLGALGNRAWLVNGETQPKASTNAQGTGVAMSAVFDEHYGYIRVGNVSAELPEQFAGALTALSKTNKLKGLVLDLRFAGGADYPAVGAVAERFLTSEQKLFEWSGGVVQSKGKPDAFRAPVAVLVNEFTSGSAEALAAVLRDTEVALLIGTNTAGNASTTKDFKLSNGQVLRVATSPLRLASGEQVFSLKPDILVEVSREDERAYFADAYRALPRLGNEGQGTNVASLSVTNRSRRRLNEAELVRMSREGLDPEEEAARAARPATPPKPVIADPKLARAIDLLKALSVVRQGRF